jgi:putative dimethyl sulfoxide reductase chaperone
MFDYGELAQMMAERQGMYKFLAGVFRREIDPELFEELGRLDFSAATGVAEIDRGFQLLGEYLRASSGATLTDLAVDYARIFLGRAPARPAAPFLSNRCIPARAGC